MSKKPIDFNKPVQTANGLPVRILCVDAVGSDYTVVGLISHKINHSGRVEEGVSRWDSHGTHVNFPAYDLCNVPAKKTGWINLYPATKAYGPYVSAAIYGGSDEAKANAGANNVIQIQIEWEE